MPDPSKLETFGAGAENPVDLKVGPGGDLFYADFDGGTIRRVSYSSSGNRPPTAEATASPTSGSPP